jgi:hypothetical protein
MSFSINSTIKDLLADERAKAVVEKHVPGASRHPQIYEVYYETLKSISYYPEAAAAGLTKEKLAAIDADLKALG